MTDGELVSRVVAGETAAYGELARRWYCRLLAYCQSRLFYRNRHDAEDLVQEVFVRGFRDLKSLHDPDTFGPWLRGIANHACSDWGRERRRDTHSTDVQEPASVSPSTLPFEEAAIADERALVMKQIAMMPDDLREVVLLHYYEELTYDEMARWLGVARATVNERLAKARGLLRNRLAKLRSDV